MGVDYGRVQSRRYMEWTVGLEMVILEVTGWFGNGQNEGLGWEEEVKKWIDPPPSPSVGTWEWTMAEFNQEGT